MAMMFSRREFIKKGLTYLGGMALLPTSPVRFSPVPAPPHALLGRVSVPAINVYASPSFSSDRVGKLERDDLVTILRQVHSSDGPAYNPLWYRLSNGYVHSGRIQLIRTASPGNPPLEIPKQGLLGEIILPYVQSQRFSNVLGWQPLYRLYFESLHWITAVELGPDGNPWYRLSDTNPGIDYLVPKTAIRIIDFNQYSPIRSNVPAEDKRIVVSLSQQSLVAYEGKRPVYQTRVSSGIHTENLPPDLLPTDTPLGVYRIQLKMPSRHMGDGHITSDHTAYELPGVPWVMVFQKDGVALHGTYWHNNFGTPMSHGCVNLRNADALWLFRWTDPVFQPGSWYQQGSGTLVQINE
jgi:lipoprotein-anchoring transpeptidase ErfK/SrfK